jgi:hypothetical protein
MSETTVDQININGVEYVRKDSIKTPEVTGDYYIVRTYSAGVFAGNIIKRNGMEVEMANARRLWYWDGAASLSQLAMDGVTNPDACKFPKEVTSIILTQAIEIIPCTKKAEQIIKAVKIWTR